MAATLNSSGILFGDGTTQTTTTPTTISSFTNDSGYVNSATVSATYALKTQTADHFGFDTGYGVYITLNNINGTVLDGGYYNCNCNC